MTSELLDTVDPEPLHRLAITTALAIVALASPLDVVPLGDTVVIVSESGICVDAVQARRAHDAVPLIVARFLQRAAIPPPGLRIDDQSNSAALAAVLEVDVASLSEPWRAAVRAFASVARHLLLTRWSARLRDVRGWQAVLVEEDAPLIELRRTDAQSIAGGAWLQPVVRIGGTSFTVRLT